MNRLFGSPSFFLFIGERKPLPINPVMSAPLCLLAEEERAALIARSTCQIANYNSWIPRGEIYLFNSFPGKWGKNIYIHMVRWLNSWTIRESNKAPGRKINTGWIMRLVRFALCAIAAIVIFIIIRETESPSRLYFSANNELCSRQRMLSGLSPFVRGRAREERPAKRSQCIQTENSDKKNVHEIAWNCQNRCSSWTR